MRAVVKTRRSRTLHIQSPFVKIASGNIVCFERSTHHIVEQSKLTSIHLFGLKLNEFAYSIPFIRCRISGQMNALPAYAASTCSHSFSRSQIGPNSCKLSNEQTPVVPSVAHTLNKSRVAVMIKQE